MTQRQARLTLLSFLGTLSAFGPFVMDMYLPTLPEMARHFATGPSMVQLSLTSGMVGLGLGQLVFGPMSDRYGRRRTLVGALLLFLLSTLGCLFSVGIGQFVVLRFFQGMAGAGGVVISRSIAADRYEGSRLTSTLAIVSTINGVATVAAPVAGGLMAGAGGWREIFWVLFALGVVLLAMCTGFDESLPTERRSAGGRRQLCADFASVLRNRGYTAHMAQYGFTMVVLFANIASAPFLMQGRYGLTPREFSLCFGANAVAMVIASGVTARFRSMQPLLRAGGRAMPALSVILLLALWLRADFWVYEGLLFLLMAALGLTQTAASTLAMAAERDSAGTASALLGAAGFACGGLVSPLAGLGDPGLTAGLLFLAGSLCTWACTRLRPAPCPAVAGEVVQSVSHVRGAAPRG